MRSLLLVFANLCLLRRGPEQVPTQTWFVISVVLADLGLSFLVSLRVSGALPPLPLATSLTVSMATTALITWILLRVRGFAPRFPATIAAIFGCDLLFTMLLAGVALASVGAFTTTAKGIVAIVGIWAIAVNGFILHRAMQVGLASGIAYAFAMAVVALIASTLAIGPSS
jgi:hypothetical protein